MKRGSAGRKLGLERFEEQGVRDGTRLLTAPTGGRFRSLQIRISLSGLLSCLPKPPWCLMILPGALAAEITEDKVARYLLNFDHPDGASKARFFATTGFTAQSWLDLAEAIRRLAIANEVGKRIETSYGTKYIVDGMLETPSGRMPVVRTVWIVDRGSVIARLVTAYPHDPGERQ